ncbi:hypothetical protein WAF17_22520 (plasmid) [Bernardetia sp. ABR2-2B]|uniref:hypothetical protein n=1 Tax=Bernardetia sp. ABR2-2B TaxID=3127472 RepID=UPI0030D38198
MKKQLFTSLFLIFISILLLSQNAFAQHDHSKHSINKINNKTVVYNLTVSDTVMELAGKKAKLLTTNG